MENLFNIPQPFPRKKPSPVSSGKPEKASGVPVRERYRDAIVELAQDSIYIVDRDGVLEYVNEHAASLIGRSSEEMTGRPLSSLFPSDALSLLMTNLRIVFDTGRTVEFEDGVTRGEASLWVHTRLQPVAGDDGSIAAVIGVARDITERKRYERVLQENQRVLSTLMSNLPGMAYRCRNDEHWTMEYVSEGCYALTGYRPLELQGAAGVSYVSLICEEDRPYVWEEVQAAVRERRPFTIEYRLRTVSGEERWVWEQGQTFVNGEETVIEGFVTDITSRKHYERAAIESEEIYSTLMDASPDAVTISDLSGRVVNVSSRMLEMHGYSGSQEVSGRSFFDLVASDDRARARRNADRVLRGEPAGPERYAMLRRDGTMFSGELSLALFRDASGGPRGFIGIMRDVTEQVKMERALLESERRYRELWDNAPVAYHTLDADGVITRVNRTEARMLGYTVEEMVGREVFDFVLPEQRREAKERFYQKLSRQALPRSENRVYVRKDGSCIYVSIDDSFEYRADGAVQGIRTTMVDVTDRKQADERIRVSLDKLKTAMESIVEAMAKIVEMKDPYTAGHQRRVGQLAAAIGRQMMLGEERVSGVHMAAVIHDIGKIYVPAEILSKPGRLTNIEFSMIKTHPSVSYDILKMVEFPWPIAQIVIQHHERFDGSGYPWGLSRDDIILEARILSVADVVEAMTFHRPYRSALGIEKALDEISANRGRLYDPDVVDACLQLFEDRSFSFDQ